MSTATRLPVEQAGPAPALKVRSLRKTYGGAVALEHLDLTVRVGEVHALLGQNGCGKSTLVKSLTGVIGPDSGTVEVYDRQVHLPVEAAHEHGIAVIHQDIGLVDEMTVLENLGANARYGTRLLLPVNNRRERRIYTELMDRVGFHFDLDAKVSTLSPSERALVAVVRAMRLMPDDAAGQLFILDEPTAALPKPEADRLLTLMRTVADLGSAVIFISHRLAEVMEVCDRATVMRAGRDVLETRIEDTDRAEIVAAMLGRRMDEFYPDPPNVTPGEVRVAVDALTGPVVRDATFHVAAGEVVGFTGLAGMGQEELANLLGGATETVSGTVLVDGADLTGATPSRVIDAGMVLVPGNRLRDGIWVAGSAEENITLPVVPQLRKRGSVSNSLIRAKAEELMAGVGVHPHDPERPLGGFSGGNQQKIVFGKWMQLDPQVLLLDEPTQGVDPGAAKDLLGRAMDAASSGSAVLVFSGEHEMLAAICHRVLVLHEGRIVAELSGADLTEESLLAASELDHAAVTASATEGAA
ncbi:sugar ABC transporter ATP-binding protein [Nocardioides bruguierae]|uniref:sugar ABC transporter ATP-binding protein n=1 Tax=Nocardioides bruguierae TaxID=2945102 RepID=UPI002021859A|nr:sugar ABC transporter ATP-binding protein [Nocardioides bruguierae]MCL8027671.1 sugar ABC transporter ATP-binding protein [Nocardioides bruguierae]